MFSDQHFPDCNDTLAHWRHRGQRDRSTLMP